MINLGSFSLADSETTQALWQTVMGNNPSHFKNCGGNCPVESVSHDDIVNKFLPRLNQLTGRKFRLPSEDEWEIAAKGTQNYIYAGSNNVREVAWYSENSNNTTHPVKQKKPNDYGLYDMSGNVWEWTNSWWNNRGNYYILRGGSWLAIHVDINLRDHCISSHGYYKTGFRLAL